ncbi:MAG: nucleoside-diphosphate-sugar epimerase [Paraglaciecola sp.]|jgi:nucleoside-diphosphate-sugar epimerase
MKALVTGGGGFVGRYLIDLLIAQGWQVRSYSRSRYDYLPGPVEQIQADLGDQRALNLAVMGCDVVFHVAAKAGVWGPYTDYHQSNVVGTEHVLNACLLGGIKYLIYTSTPSVIHSSGGVEGPDESIPYPTRFKSHYAHTKAIAEQAVLAAHSPALSTVALRPHLVWGPNDPHFIPRLKQKSQQGSLRLIGAGDCLVDHIYVENAAWAHLCAARALISGEPVGGRAYFLSQNAPLAIAELINGLLHCVDEPSVAKHIPLWLAKIVGAGVEDFYRIARITAEPPLSRFLVDQLSTPHWFDCSASARLLNYHPRVSTKEGLQRLQQWWHRQV